MNPKIEILYFSATWCGPCKMFKPIFDQFISEHPEVECKFIDVEQSEGYEHFRVMAVPTIIFLKNGIECERLSGSKSKKVLEQTLEDITF
jgi:thiol-disulfide isomerase/thioredoxin